MASVIGEDFCCRPIGEFARKVCPEQHTRHRRFFLRANRVVERFVEPKKTFVGPDFGPCCKVSFHVAITNIVRNSTTIWTHERSSKVKRKKERLGNRITRYREGNVEFND
jgi:hypothetical protein